LPADRPSAAPTGTGAGNPLADLVGIEEGTLIALLAALRDRGETVATAESLTAGLVSSVLTSVSGASAVLRGGLVVYASDLKSGLAGVDPELLAKHGPVHPDVAAQLATGARQRCTATWGVGLTGVAGPQSQNGVEPGTVHIAIDCPDRNAPIVRSVWIHGDRHHVRASATHLAINMLVEVIAAA
jgi:nicotinamide-nucleotide amidase